MRGYSRLHLIDVASIDAFLHVRQTPQMQRRVRQHAVHPGKAINRQEAVQNSHHEQVQVVSAALFQPVPKGEPKGAAISVRSEKADDALIARIVDHGFGDVLIHKNEERQGES